MLPFKQKSWSKFKKLSDIQNNLNINMNRLLEKEASKCKNKAYYLILVSSTSATSYRPIIDIIDAKYISDGRFEKNFEEKVKIDNGEKIMRSNPKEIIRFSDIVELPDRNEKKSNSIVNIEKLPYFSEPMEIDGDSIAKLKGKLQLSMFNSDNLETNIQDYFPGEYNNYSENKLLIEHSNTEYACDSLSTSSINNDMNIDYSYFSC